VREFLERYRIAELADRYPSQLSGGQQQRVALARMLASEPEVILLDEPFSALDSFLRRQVEEELSASLSEYPGSVIFVSHDRDEVFRFCDTMIILDGGSIAREGKRDEVFADPQTVSAARLTGCKNIAGATKAGERRIAVPSWGLILETERTVPDGITHAGIRAHHIRAAGDTDTVNCFNFSVESRSEAPFSVTEYVTALTAAGVAGGDRNHREPLRRESAKQGNTDSTERLCLPPECLLLLT
jgi:molybdate transport system ATP-binding protein